MKHSKKMLIGTLLLTLLLVNMVALASAYDYSGNGWSTNYAQYTRDSSIPSGWSTPISNAAYTQSNAGANFYFYAIGCNNKLYYSNYGGTDPARTYNDLSGTYLVKCTTYFNSAFSWSTANSCPTSQIDVQNAATHEFGHWLRLKDLYWPILDSEKTMYYSSTLGETKKRTLESDDVNGIKAIYV